MFLMWKLVWYIILMYIDICLEYLKIIYELLPVDEFYEGMGFYFVELAGKYG